LAEMKHAKKEEDIVKPVKRRTSAGACILGVLGYLLMLAVVVSCLCLVVPSIAGYDEYVVVSGSMEPNIPVRSIVLAKEVDPAQLQNGDVIVFIDPNIGTTPITHRVVSNDPASGTIITKGDANPVEDPDPAIYSNVKGKVYAHIPYIGLVAATLTSAIGKAVAALFMFEAWLLIEISRRMKKRNIKK